MKESLGIVVSAFLLLALWVPDTDASVDFGDKHGFSVLVFSKTAGFRHDSIDEGIQAIQDMGIAHSFDVDATEDATLFTDATLDQYDLVVFLNTTGDVLTIPQQEAFERFIRSGGGFVGIHSATDTEYDWPFYGDLVGAYFDNHPATQSGTILVADRQHPSSASLPERWTRTDEWYNFQTNPRGNVHVLATLSEDSFSGGTMGVDHPIAWCHNFEGGRSWYTALGHTEGTFTEPEFVDHLLNGIEWAAGAIAGECAATVDANYELVPLDSETDNPIGLDIAPDGRVFYVELGGAVKVYKPDINATVSVANLSVFEGNEHGILGIELDPSFESNGWVYIFYSPLLGGMQRLSRFTVEGDAFNMATEEVLLEFPTERGQCCHNAGSMSFDSSSNLYLATGDDSNPFESSGYAPIDERAGRSAWDAQRSSGNTDDLRGKILRITPQADGTYTIPAGNLFPSDGSVGRPEIFVMGVRNPFRISIDAETGWLYWGDVGPDAGADDVNRGPRGYDEWNRAQVAGNFGWPYCIGDNFPYVDYDFATGSSSGSFDCSNLSNDSPNNSGELNLPSAEPAWIWYPYGPSSEFPAITDGSGRTAMAGPVYHYDALSTSDTRLPEYFDDVFLIYEWSRNWIHEVRLDDSGEILAINPILSGLTFQRPIDMEVGPDGNLYMIEWGTGFGGNNNDSRLIRIDYRPGGGTPVAIVSTSAVSGPIPLTVMFSAADSYDPDSGTNLEYEWDFQSDGIVDATSVETSFTYTTAGVYVAQLRVTDPDSNYAIVNTTITAGNTIPVVTISAPFTGGFYDWGDEVKFDVSVVDAEDGSTGAGTIDCAEVTVRTSIGHDDHSHPLDVLNGCTGSFNVIDGHGNDADNLFYVVEVSYTDEGASGAPLTGTAQQVLYPKRLEAEHFDATGGVDVESTGDVNGGGENIGFIDHGDYVVFEDINLTNISFVTYRVASAGTGGKIEIRLGSPSGEVVSNAFVEVTGQWQLYRDVTTSIDETSGVHDLYFVFVDNPGSGGLFNVNWIEFIGTGVVDPEDAVPHGLSATYFNGPEFSGRITERVDPKINFNWSTGEPVEFVVPDNFSVRWIGQVEAQFDENYTFFARSSDGMRVWLDGVLIIDRWQDQNTTEVSSLLQPLVASQRYDLVVEYYEATGEAQAHLSWSSLSTPKAIVPDDVLYPDASSTSVDPLDVPAVTELGIESVYPNPAARILTVEYVLPHAGESSIDVFDAIGRMVLSLSGSVRLAGINRENLDVSNLATGSYLIRVTQGGRQISQPLLVIR